MPMKLGNGVGTVYKLSGKRRNPYIVRKTVGWEIDVETGKWTTVLENEDSYNWPAKLSPNGRYLLYNKLKGLSDNHLFF